MGRVVAVFGALLLLFVPPARGAETRHGLIPLGGKAADLADLLTAELSKL